MPVHWQSFHCLVHTHQRATIYGMARPIEGPCFAATAGAWLYVAKGELSSGDGDGDGINYYDPSIYFTTISDGKVGSYRIA